MPWLSQADLCIAKTVRWNNQERKADIPKAKVQEEIKAEPTDNVYEDGTSDDAFFDDFFADD